MESAIFTPFNAKKFNCESCDFGCSKPSDWSRHLLTSKHKRLTNTKEITPKNAEILECICGKNYKHMSSLCKHKKICSDVKQYNFLQTSKTKLSTNNNDSDCDSDSDSDSDNDNEPSSETPANENLIQYLLKENADFKSLIMELVKKEFINNSINNTTNNVNSNNNNNSFCLNLFLNDTCKGAMNMSEFVDTIAIQMSDLENFAHMDYADGVSKILLKNLNNLDTNQRPIHCTDLKRETVYIKENNCWTKETDDKPNLKSAIKLIAFKNIKQINEWVKEHPGCRDPTTKQNVKYNKIVMNSMSGGTIQEQHDNIEKIVKNVTKAVTIDKCALK